MVQMKYFRGRNDLVCPVVGARDSAGPPRKQQHRQAGHAGEQIPELERTDSVVRAQLPRTRHSGLGQKLPDHSPRQR